MKKKILTGLATGALMICGGVNTAHADPVLINSATWSSNGHEYILYAANGTTWQDAKQWVTNNFSGCYLASVTSAEENVFINTSLFANQGGEYWLGGFQDPNSTAAEKGWKWDSGETWSYTNWNIGEPNDFYGPGSEQYLGANWRGGHWNDEGNLGNITGFVVEVAPVPEPATMLLFGTGIAGLAGVVRRKRS